MNWLSAIIVVVALSGPTFAQGALVGNGEVLRPKLAATPPVIDGVLDDPAWQTGPLVTGPFIANRPVYGEAMPERTEVWLTYDGENIYFAFYCHDDHPERIQGTMAKRDDFLSEDWVGVDLDSMGSRQKTYEHIINPLGIQADLINSVSSGESADPDWVWYSAGKITRDGYVVEVRLPLKSLTYKAGHGATMNLAFYRYVSRTGTNASWPQMDPKKGYFNSLVPVVFDRLEPKLRLEALPALTYSHLRERETPDTWGEADDSWQAGLDLKYGLTSTSTVELSLNPDFSQVESDQFQILANQRYPVFYNEKRPFFMDVASQFNLAGANGNGNMSSAVHTRTIVDPAWGIKLTGEFSRFALGVLAAGDEWPGRAWSDGENPHRDRNANFFIGRAKYSAGSDAYFGLLYSGREFAGEYNRVIAGDAHFRLAGKHDFSLNGIHSFSRAGAGEAGTEGGAFTVNYDYSQKPLLAGVLVEDYGRDFRMDSAFYQRTGFFRAYGFVQPRFYPRWPGLPWVKSTSLFAEGSTLHDRFTGRNDSLMSVGTIVNTLWQGSLTLQFSRSTEYWAGRTFTQHQLYFYAGIQPKKWLNTHVNITRGEGIYYDSVSPFLGDKFYFHTCVYLQFSRQLKQHFSYVYQDFHRADDRRHVYDLHILVSRTTFQFNKYLFARSLLQFDSYEKKVLTDLLASFTLIPGTVVHVGYGSLCEKRGWQEGDWKRSVTGSEYRQMRQSFFCKVSYRIQF